MVKLFFNLLKTIPVFGPHSIQVAFLASQIAKELSLDEAFAFQAGLFHDIGILVPSEESFLFDDIDSSFLLMKDFSGKPLHLHSILGSFVMGSVPRLKPLSNVLLKHHFPAYFLDEKEKIDVYANIVFLADQVSKYYFLEEITFAEEIFLPLEDIKSFFFENVYKCARTVLGREHTRWVLEDIKNGVFNEELLEEYLKIPSSRDDLIQMGKLVSFIIDSKSKFTAEHSWRVAILSQKLGNMLRRDHGETLFIAGLFHDVGKISVRYHLLEKPEKLNNEEYEEMKKHIHFSYRILLSERDKDWFLPAVRHHERLDGSGYPFRLKGDAMSTLDKIMQICDTFCAMVEQRPYRPPYTREEAIKKLEEQVMQGKYDKEVFGMLLEVLKDLDVKSLEIGETLRKQLREFTNEVLNRYAPLVR